MKPGVPWNFVLSGANDPCFPHPEVLKFFFQFLHFYIKKKQIIKILWSPGSAMRKIITVIRAHRLITKPCARITKLCARITNPCARITKSCARINNSCARITKSCTRSLLALHPPLEILVLQQLPHSYNICPAHYHRL